MGKDVIVACDFASAEATFAFLDKFNGCSRKPFVKIVEPRSVPATEAAPPVVLVPPM